jgi:hypothetical protein
MPHTPELMYDLSLGPWVVEIFFYSQYRYDTDTI